MENRQYLSTLKINHMAAVEVAEDFEMPEYQPEIRRAAGVQCTVTRDNAFLEGSNIEVSGCVLYTVLYMSGEGGMASAPFFSTWTAKIPLPEEGGVGVEDLLMTAESENVVCRVTGPRKMNLSARVKLRCTALGESDCTVVSEPAGDPTITYKMEETPVARLKTCRYTGTVSGELSGTAVIACRGTVHISEVRRVPEGLSVTGEAAVRFLTRGEEGSYVTQRSRGTISEVIPCPKPLWGDTPADSSAFREEVSAVGKCAALTVAEGEDGVIRWEMEYDLEGTLFGEGTSVIAADGYCAAYEDTPVFRQADSVSGGSCIRGQITLTGEKALRGDDVGNLQFLYGWGRGVFEKGERLPGGRLLLTGSAHCTALLTGNGDVVAEDVILPIRYECAMDDMGESSADGLDCRCGFTVWDVGGHMDGTVLHLHVEAGCEGLILRRTSCTWLGSLTRREPLPKARPAVILYTPDPGETAWDVQKRYRTAAISEADGRYVVRK